MMIDALENYLSKRTSPLQDKCIEMNDGSMV